MPVLLQHIDAIARAKQRDVLHLEFHPKNWDACRAYYYENDSVRADIIAWLDGRGIKWVGCGPYADINRIESYRGQIYIDLPFDAAAEEYCQLRDYLEYPDGSMRQPTVRFYVTTLGFAMKNSAHDEPGFWESHDF